MIDDRAPRSTEKLAVGESPANKREEAEQSFIRGVLQRGEAGYRAADGSLPQPFKFAIVGQHADGLPVLERVRI